MGKAEKGTPKYIANKMKAKGLQKLRWYCQMCEKQCRDENGFKCHTMSESHQRQLLLFANSPGKYLGNFSGEFVREFLYLLKRQFGTKRTLANKVYQEYISDRKHVHMNSTQWETLTDFVKWLGRQGKCVVDETEKGWFIAYIDRDPEVIQEQEKKEKKEKMARDDEEEQMAFIEKQIERDKKKETAESKPTELLKKDDEKLTLNLNLTRVVKTEKLKPLVPPLAVPSSSKEKKPVIKKPDRSLPLSNLEAIKKEGEERKKRKLEQTSYKDSKKAEKERPWLAEGIVVKVITSALGEEFNGKKGIVRQVIDEYGAIVKMINSSKKIKVDQSHLQTVIPNFGMDVKILSGKYRGAIGELLDVRMNEYSVDVRIKEPSEWKGISVRNLEYEEISKIPVDGS